MFLRNTRDCGQRRKELFIYANGGNKMRGMILLQRKCFSFRFSYPQTSFTLSRNKKINSKSFNYKGRELGML